MAELLRDLRYAIRSFARTPRLAAAVVATLALGIGANTAIFSVVSAVLLRGLPYPDVDRLVVVWNPRADVRDDTWLSGHEVVEYQRNARSYEQFAAYVARDANLTGGDEPERVRAAAVTANAFDTLGVSALLGRTFTPADDVPGEGDAVIIGEGLWQRRFGGDPRIIGRSIRVNARPRTVVGVMPASVKLPLDYREERGAELWLPLALDPANLGGWGNRSFHGFGRLRPSTSAAAATAELGVLWQRWVQAGYVEDDREQKFERAAIPVQDLVVGGLRPALGLQSAVVGLVLLIACVNASSLLLARAEAKRTEVAVRTALGASSVRIVRQTVTEGVLLSAAGAVAGTAVAIAGVELLTWLRPASIPRLEEVRVDTGTLLFTTGLCMLCGTLVGFPPALAALRRDPAEALHGSSRSTSPSATRAFRRALVITEIALAVVLLTTAGLLVRSLAALQAIDLGYRTDGLLTFRVALPPPDYPDAVAVTGFYARLIERVEQLPGVQSAAAVRVLPLTDTIGDWSITIEGQPRRPGENPNGDWQVVTPGYFEALRIPLVRGRLLSPADRTEAPPVAVINETMAARYWSGQDAIGKRFRLGTRSQPWITVVGVVRTVRHNAVVEPPRAEMALAHAQFAAAGGSVRRDMTIVVRTAGDPMAMVAAAREAVRSLDRNLPVADVRSFASVVAAAYAPARFVTLLVSLFAALAVGLAAIGVSSLVTFDVSRRRREIGIRMALGGAAGQVVRMVTWQGMVLAAAGIGLGVLGALGLTRVLGSQLFGVTPTDPLTFVTATLAMTVAVLAATWFAARHAARVDPIVTLRAD